MKNSDFQSQEFRDLTMEENYAYSGGGFAYDAGRFLRFMVISAGGGVNLAMAIADAAMVQTK